MKKLRVLLPAVIAGIFFYSCDRCGKVYCLPTNYYGRFRILDSATGADLVFGSRKVYDKAGIRFYSLKGADTTFLEYKPATLSGSADSVLQVYFYPEVATAYMSLGNGDTDTLALTYEDYHSACCGDQTLITRYRLNGSADISGLTDFQVIRK